MKERFSFNMLLGSLAAGCVYAVLGEILYAALHGLLPGPAVILCYFVGMGLFLVLVVGMIGKALYARTSGKAEVKKIALTVLIIFLAAGLFEFLYELEFRHQQEDVTSYTFVLDNSGSMESSDPEQKRIDAVFTTLEHKGEDFPFAVYSFSDICTNIRRMAPISEGVSLPAQTAYGGTAIRGTLEQVWRDIESGVFDPGENGKILLLSDGAATDMLIFGRARMSGLLKKYAKRGIEISTVGLGNADSGLMQFIANKTGGVFIAVDDVGDLETAMQDAMKNRSSRDLLSYRGYCTPDVLYAIMRIVFIAILGTLIGLNKAYICERFLDTKPVFFGSLTGSVTAGIVLELGMNVCGFSPFLMRALMCVLIAFTLLREDYYEKHYRPDRIAEGLDR